MTLLIKKTGSQVNYANVHYMNVRETLQRQETMEISSYS